jgi:predicted site-specific integrase-resolvase
MTDGYLEINVMPIRQRMDVKEASHYTGLSEWTLRKWSYAGKVASIKLSTRLLFDKTELDRILAENTRPRTAA